MGVFENEFNSGESKVDSLVSGTKEKADELGDRAATALEAKLEEAKVKADKFSQELGEDNVWNAIVEYAAGQSTAGATWVLENFGKQIADVLIFMATWHPKAARLIPNRKLRTLVQITSLFSLVGGSAIEGALRHFEKQGKVSPETVEWLNNNGIEPLEKLNIRQLVVEAFTGDSLSDEHQGKLDEYYNDPETSGFQKMFGKLYGRNINYNKGGLVARKS